MKDSIPLILIILISSIITIGCGEKQEPKLLNQAIFDNYKKEAQTFKLTDRIKTFVGREGTKITIDPKSLEIIGGNKISGNIEIQLTEYYKPVDIVLANLSTSSNSELIETGGMIKLTATSNGQEVVVKKGEEFQIEFSSAEKESMEIFYGKTENGLINWLPREISTQTSKAGFFFQAIAQDTVRVFDQVDTTVAAAITESDSVVKNNILKCSKFGWINCDRFLGLDKLTTMKIKYDTIYKPSLYLVFKKINSIMPSFYEKTYGKFINLPVKYDVTLIAFSINDDKTYYSSKEILIEEEMEMKIDFKEVPLYKIKEEVEKIIK